MEFQTLILFSSLLLFCLVYVLFYTTEYITLYRIGTLAGDDDEEEAQKKRTTSRLCRRREKSLTISETFNIGR